MKCLILIFSLLVCNLTVAQELANTSWKINNGSTEFIMNFTEDSLSLQTNTELLQLSTFTQISDTLFLIDHDFNDCFPFGEASYLLNPFGNNIRLVLIEDSCLSRSSFLNALVLTPCLTNLIEAEWDDFIIYPNPSIDGFFYLDEAIDKAIVFDINGNTIADVIQKSVLDLSRHPIGNYLIRITNGKTTKVGRLIKM